VTIIVEGVTLKAHKVVLSACSRYFKAVLRIRKFDAVKP
jgi:hypothetical protein